MRMDGWMDSHLSGVDGVSLCRQQLFVSLQGSVDIHFMETNNKV